jgi:hypothetical protein
MERESALLSLLVQMDGIHGHLEQVSCRALVGLRVWGLAVYPDGHKRACSAASAAAAAVLLVYSCLTVLLLLHACRC